jgi:hypothetical protein
MAPWGSETRIRPRGEAVVLMDETAEQIPPVNIVRTDGDRIPGFGSWRGEAEGAMGPPAVLVLDLGGCVGNRHPEGSESHGRRVEGMDDGCTAR